MRPPFCYTLRDFFRFEREKIRVFRIFPDRTVKHSLVSGF